MTVTNPLSSQHSVMRQSLIGSLLEVIETNVRQGRQDVAIFEIGKGYGATEDGDRRTNGGAWASPSPVPPRSPPGIARLDRTTSTTPRA